tara:strand:+ start:259 stop:717 length:459 start_codon:yes stop_codon:yes gene_type:complete
MEFVFNDGGRSQYFKGKRDVSDCVPRAIAIATGLDYKQVYDDLNRLTKEYASNKRTKVAKKLTKGRQSVRDGTYKEVYKPYLESLGWTWIPTMKIGQGCKVHLDADELPTGTIICSVSRHLVTVVDGIINDTYDCSREGTRCVYGYFTKGEA